MIELPVNCLFDKGKTGCGGTTLALKNEKDTIIAMPFVSLIKNKIAQHGEDVLGVYKDVTDKEIIDYIETHKKKKILVTYDSLKRLEKVLSSQGIDVFNSFYLLIDEWHILFNSYAFRRTAINGVLDLAKKFKEVTYMTATPIEDEFILEELKDIPVKQVVWLNTVNVKVIPVETNKPYKKVCDLIEEALDNKIFGNLHFFVNSVDFIAQVISKTGISPDNIRVICSKNTEANQRKLGSHHLIEETTDPVKKINFYTSTCFEGCDIYDDDGRTYIVSDKSKSHTLLDISTLFIQICGRIRKSRYNGEVTHIFTQTKYRYGSSISLDEYKEKVNSDLSGTKAWIKEIHDMSEESRIKTIRGLKDINERYIRKENDFLIVDENLVKVDIMNFKITNHLYKARIILDDEYKRAGFDIGNTEIKYYPTDKLAENPKARIAFKDLFLEYAALRDSIKGRLYFGNPDDRISLIEKEKPLIKEAYEILGVEKVTFLKYNQTNIKRELMKQTDASTDIKIIGALKDMGIEANITIASKRLKEVLQEIYNVFGRHNKAKATDIENWFDVKRVSPKMKGKTVDSIYIIRKKLNYS